MCPSEGENGVVDAMYKDRALLAVSFAPLLLAPAEAALQPGQASRWQQQMKPLGARVQAGLQIKVLSNGKGLADVSASDSFFFFLTTALVSKDSFLEVLRSRSFCRACISPLISAGSDHKMLTASKNN